MTKQEECKKHIVEAAEVYWGTFCALDKVIVLHPSNPEFEFLQKEKIYSLSREAQQALEIIMSLPDEMFLGTGRVKKEELRWLLRQRFHWSWKTISLTLQELRNFAVT